MFDWVQRIGEWLSRSSYGRRLLGWLLAVSVIAFVVLWKNGFALYYYSSGAEQPEELRIVRIQPISCIATVRAAWYMKTVGKTLEGSCFAVQRLGCAVEGKDERMDLMEELKRLNTEREGIMKELAQQEAGESMEMTEEQSSRYEVMTEEQRSQYEEQWREETAEKVKKNLDRYWKLVFVDLFQRVCSGKESKELQKLMRGYGSGEEAGPQYY